ncbi:AfsR/SARP family transcriptional regulator [Streptomyces sp. DG2A-72]|uniref:AfsR/SARP family transcriptional regulator n=1 Tax=Streptomyces sp. DG2A-72 TaxID=3051386 RepID=UPI00265BAF10|nr:AfsR/SARP family transcriptional regulator [Streptomyces sp. DG2A-72]MDO0931737.1 AfsR/SARP family transcriptional regulator [Streptomyces sp. DG2A-72]
MDIALLGPLGARIGQASVVPSAAKPRKVLALLGLDCGRPVSVSILVDELWGDRPPRSAEATLHTYVKQLRRLIAQALEPDAPRRGAGNCATSHDGPADKRQPIAARPAERLGPRDLLRRVPGGYLLDVPAESTDAARFEHLATAGRQAIEKGVDDEGCALLMRALRLWRGPVLADVEPGFVLRAEALRLEELRMAALEERFDAELRLGRHRVVLGELASLASRFPLHEALHAQLILALHRSGRSWQALETFRALRRTLADELGLEPSSRLRELHEAVLRGDPALDSEGTWLPRPLAAR